MFGYAVLVCAAAVLFWLDPLLRVLAPSLVPDAPVLPRTPRPRLNEALLALEDVSAENEGGTRCPPDAYTVHIFNKAPLVLYVENFLSADERQHLLDISAPIYEPSTVTHDGGSSVQRDVTVRDSAVAVVPRTPTVRCIEARARALQGWRDELWIERLRVQRYVAPAGHYGFHYDWSRSGAATGGWGRVASLMVFVDDGSLEGGDGSRGGGDGHRHLPLQGGGTAFPRLPRRSNDARWCSFIACSNDSDGSPVHAADAEFGADLDAASSNTTGVVFKPVVGNAVFWENFRPDGTGRAYEETWHAGLRVLQGVKVGLNIWSWGRVD
ncbi:2og-Fe oxygenase family protein [Niveomyces insectorum RCEF 264]|uniref:2og-Fe oxygenase family protein n=1 Tax=Niveomyces insectorum RCEF 264 TaxID=1081102 RepID=A0A167Y292_9HYPO|nr:2og-Fe oxygenase family protein [Niveomyces insectorum RCEF 264]